MSHYTYTDHDGDKITIISPDGPYVSFEIASEDAFGAVSAKAEDAPAIALAILEAAGIREDDTSRPNLSSALVNLQVHEAHRKDDAAREALDAKVAEFRELSLSAIALAFRDSNSRPKVWSALPNEGREGWRARYRAAREFFQERP